MLAEMRKGRLLMDLQSLEQDVVAVVVEIVEQEGLIEAVEGCVAGAVVHWE